MLNVVVFSMLENCTVGFKMNIRIVLILGSLLCCKLTYSYDITLSDNFPPNANVLDLNALINADGRQSRMIYTLTKIYKASEYFEIRNDKIFTKSAINIDLMCSRINECCNKDIDYCDLKIRIVYFHNLKSDVKIRDLRIHVKDINDHIPKFEDLSQDIHISESKRDPHIVSLPLADDSDFGENRIQNYQIGSKVPGLFDEYFSLIVNKDGNLISQVSLKLIRNLDRETISLFQFQLLAIDGGRPIKNTGSILIKIVITDENDNNPIFSKNVYHEIIKEGFFSSLPIVVLSATDIDAGENAKILFSFGHRFTSDSSITDQFKIDFNGNIYLKKPLDYERKTFYKFSVTATNPTPSVNSSLVQSTATVEIEVENVDDEPLQIIVDYAGSRNFSMITENNPDSFIAFITARSTESDRKTVGIVCNLQSYADKFELLAKPSDDIHTKSFEVRTVSGIDREAYPRIETIIICNDSNSPNSKYSEAPFVVVILDENDNMPVLKIQGQTIVKENEVIGKVIFTVKASDPDEGENGRVTFSLDKSNPISLDYLTIGENDGKVKVKVSIDCESSLTPLTHLDIIVTGTDHGRPQRSTDLHLQVTVQDVNDNVPLFLTQPLKFSIVENSPELTLVGEIEVQDKDHSDKVTLKLIYNNQLSVPFTITTKDNKIFFLNAVKSIDREKDAMFSFQIVASDGLGIYAHSVTESVEVKVLDVNDNAPMIIFPTQNNVSIHRISFLESVNHKFILVSANDLDQPPDNNRLEYLIYDDLKLFGIANDEKYIVTQREMTTRDLGEHKVQIIVRDSGIPQLESSVTINIVIDQSPPMSGSSSGSVRLNTATGDRRVSSISDIILYITVAVILFVIIIVCILFVYFLRRFKKEGSCFYNLVANSCTCIRSPNFVDKSTLPSSQRPKSNFNDGTQTYVTRQLPLINDENTFNESNQCETLNPDTSRASSYNIANNPYMSYKSPYAKLINHQGSYYPLQLTHIYQTIEDGRGLMRHERVPSGQLRGGHGEQYKSELNLRKWNFMDNDSNEVFTSQNRFATHWVTSHTPLPTRSRHITNTVLNKDLDDDNFAVAFPRDQSTFV